jgi:tetratricopeptide (TPR) repeat protein
VRSLRGWLLILLLIASGVGGAEAQNPPLSDDSAVGLAQAKSLVREGKNHEAEMAVRRLVDSGKDSEGARSLLGLVLYQEGRPTDSLAEFTRAARFKTPTASELIIVALDYVMLRDLAKADKWMTVAVQVQPDNVAGWRYLGGIKYSENRFSEAIESYGKCLALQPRDVLVEDGIGRSLEGLARDQDAAAAYKTALDWQAEATQKHPEPLLHLGALLVREGRLPSALPLLVSAETMASENADIHEELGNLWGQMGELKKAQLELEKALAISPSNSHLHWLLASIYRKEGMTAEAGRELREYSTLIGSHSTDKLQ